ncbi:MAG: histidinol-phosphate transaminase [Clostridia bacterium]|nr:histidinol-phosphate transaminase [Clostridia bacterium]MBQ9774337.1 histidinol-phosphate transaminase [Clostridia bacterium]
MSRFFSKKHSKLVPYVPGEQPKDMQYIKLNTNESPFPPSEEAQRRTAEAAKRLQLYCDPECRELTERVADRLGVSYDEVLMTNGSDEILNFAFMAFCDEAHPAVFPNITYGFYSVFAEINHVPYEEIPLRADFSVNVEDYIGIGKNIFLANPNAPTGIALTRDKIERIVASNPDNIVVIDEAYVDFGGESCVPLVRKYDNLIVTQTFSKSRSMAGARLGMGIASPALIQDLNTIKYSTNPYNVNSMTQAAGIGTMLCDGEAMQNCKIIMENREHAARALAEMGFVMTDSKTNFLFARHPKIDGQVLYEKLRARGILVRHFSKPLIAQYNRITVGTREQMQTLIDTIRTILEE